ncbi:MAG: polyprenyl synthetase family protein [Halobacteria archaeon]|nr:polyprenyl synthetase family protein [Halobacteria archaeon]
MRDVLDKWRPVIDEEIEKVLPREIKNEYLEDFFGDARYTYDAGAIHDGLSVPTWDVLDRGGKRWRAVLFLMFIEAFGEDPNEYLPYACIPEILHNGTIIVDDVEDDASLRRGEPALHLKYGTDVAINAGNALYFLPLKIVSRNPADLNETTKLKIYDMLSYELNRTHLGQGTDIIWHGRKDTTTDEEKYLEMCACKTGSLARIASRLAAIVTRQTEEDEEAVGKYAELMSIAFQISDDILDVENTLGRTEGFGKEVGNDIREGKKTLMVIHAVKKAEPNEARRLEEILSADENTDDEILEAIDILQETGSIEHARETALELSAQAREHLDRVDMRPEPKKKLADFSRFVVERRT